MAGTQPSSTSDGEATGMRSTTSTGADDATPSSGEATGTGGSTNPSSASTSTGTELCDPSCPTGHCDAQGRCARYVFVTSEAIRPNFGGVAGADAACALAAKGVLPGTFVAFVRAGLDSGASAWTHAQLDRDDGSVFVLPPPAGNVVAESALDFGPDDSSLLHAIDHDVDGDSMIGRGASTGCNDAVLPERVWTGYVGGDLTTPAGPANSCEDWSSQHFAVYGGLGRYDATDGSFAGAASCFCETHAHLYCFEIAPIR